MGKPQGGQSKGGSATTVEQAGYPVAPTPYRSNKRRRQFRGTPANPSQTGPATSEVGQGTQPWQTYNICGKRHLGRCRLGQDVCYHCGQAGHFIKKYPQRAIQQSMPLVSQTIVQMDRPRGRGYTDKEKSQMQPPP